MTFHNAWDLIKLILCDTTAYCIVRVLAADMECSRFSLQDSLEEILDRLIITDLNIIRPLRCDLIQSSRNLQTFYMNLLSRHSGTLRWRKLVPSNRLWIFTGIQDVSISVYDKIHSLCNDNFNPSLTSFINPELTFWSTFSRHNID